MQTSASIRGGGRHPHSWGVGGHPFAAFAKGAWHPWVRRELIAHFDFPLKRIVLFTAVGKSPRLLKSEPLSLSFKHKVHRCHSGQPGHRTRLRPSGSAFQSRAVRPAAPPSHLLFVRQQLEGPWVGVIGTMRVVEEQSRGKETFILFPGDMNRERCRAEGSELLRKRREKWSCEPTGCRTLLRPRSADPSKWLPRHHHPPSAFSQQHRLLTVWQTGSRITEGLKQRGLRLQ